MKFLGVEVTYEEFDYLMCQQSEGKELKVADGKVVAVDPEISNSDKIRLEIDELLYNLNKTDWIVIKISEAETEEEKQALRLKYANELAKRKEWRKRINELEANLEDNK